MAGTFSLALLSSNWKHISYIKPEELIIMTDGGSEEKNSTIATMSKINKSIISGLIVKVPLNCKLYTDKLVYL